MSDTPPDRFYFDYVDPLSYLMEIELGEAEERLGLGVARTPFELRPPPEPMLDAGDRAWQARWEAAARQAGPGGLQIGPPRLVPWTRKAHELVLYAGEHDLGARAHHSLFDRVLRDGADVGRIDVLVELAVELGLDRTDTKASLDVDRHAAAVVRARQDGIEAGVLAPPALVGPHGAVEGFRNAREIVKFFRSH